MPGRDGINVWVPVAEQGAALLHLAAAGVRAASGDPFWISPPGVRPHPDHHLLHRTAPTTDLADLVADAARAGTWAGHR